MARRNRGAARNKWLLDASEVQVYFDHRKVLPSYSPAMDGNRPESVATKAHLPQGGRGFPEINALIVDGFAAKARHGYRYISPVVRHASGG
jgi:hypothetical protein